MHRLDLRLNCKWTDAAAPIFAYTILTVLANRIGVIALGRANDAAMVGVFAAGDRLCRAFDLPFIMFTGAIFPIQSTPLDTVRVL